METEFPLRQTRETNKRNRSNLFALVAQLHVHTADVMVLHLDVPVMFRLRLKRNNGDSDHYRHNVRIGNVRRRIRKCPIRVAPGALASFSVHDDPHCAKPETQPPLKPAGSESNSI